MKKKIIIVVVVLFVLAAIGGTIQDDDSQSDSSSTAQNTAQSQEESTDTKQSSAEEKQERSTTEVEEASSKKAPEVSIDSRLDDTNIDSYKVTKDGITLNLSNSRSEKDWISYEIKSFELNGETVYMNYDSGKDKYIAEGVTVKENGKKSYWGMFQIQGGASSKIKFSVKGFNEIEDYDGFKVTLDLKYAGSFSGKIKDDYIQVHVS